MELQSDVRRLIVKANPASEAAIAVVQAAGLFARETKVMKETLPRLQRALAAGLSHRPAEHLQIGPTIFAVLSNGALVMEDLSARVGSLTLSGVKVRPMVRFLMHAQGYTNVPRRDGLDLPHSLAALRLLARMHAASLVVHDRSPEDALTLESYCGGWTSSAMRPTFERLVAASMPTLATAVRAWPSLGEDVARRLERAGKTGPAKATAALTAQEGSFQVLCHGDCWSNNIMFAYDEDTAQVGRRSSTDIYASLCLEFSTSYIEK